MPEETIFQKPSNLTPPQNPIGSSPPADHEESFFSKHSKLFKIAGAIFIVLTVIFSLLAIFSPKSSEKVSDENVTLTYWGWEDEETKKALIAAFEAENPRIKINYEKQDPEDYVEKLNVRVPNGNGPDIFAFHNSWYPVLSGVLLPLPKETIEKGEFENSFYNVMEKDLIKNGAIYGIPQGIDTLALFVNRDLFSEPPPLTWQQFIDSSEALTKRNTEGKIETAGAGIGTFENIDNSPDLISLLFAQNGVDFDDLSSSRSKIIDALRFYTNFALLENNVWDDTLDSSRALFAKGQVAMYFGYFRDISEIKKLNPNLNFEIYPVPQLSSDKKSNIASYWASGVSSASEHQKEALLFLKFLAREEFRDKPSSVFLTQAENSVSSPFVDGTYNNGLSVELNSYLRESINAVLSGNSEESAADILIQGYSSVMVGSSETATDQPE